MSRTFQSFAPKAEFKVASSLQTSVFPDDEAQASEFPTALQRPQSLTLSNETDARRNPALSEALSSHLAYFKRAKEEFVHNPENAPFSAAGFHLRLRFLSRYTPKPRPSGKVAKHYAQLSGRLKLFIKIMQDWEFAEQKAAALLGYEHISYITDLYAGLIKLRHRDQLDRLYFVLRIAADLDSLFKEREFIRHWLLEPQPLLGNFPPADLLADGSILNIIRVQQYVEYISGRRCD